MAMDGFTKDMNIIQQLNDEPNDRDGLTAGELKAKFDEGGLAVKDYLNNTVKPFVDGMEGTEAAHEADTVRHITAAERTAWNGKYDKTGGTLSGNVTVQPGGVPTLTLSAPEKSGTGRSKTVLYKNASASSDNGTQLTDYVWGDGTTDNRRTMLRLQSAAAALKDRLTLIDYAAGGNYVLYHLYGEHNQPAVADITGLQTALDGKAAVSHAHGSIRTDGSIGQDTDPEVSDRLVIVDVSDRNKIKRGNIRLDGSTTDKALTPKGTWEPFLKTHQDISGKVDKVTGKGLSTNDYTTAEKNKLAGIAAGAQVNSITGVKGNAETNYRTGNVNLTPANIGAAAASHSHDYLPLAGGTLMGDLMVQLNTGIPSFSLRASEKEGVGRARMMLYKEAGSTDYGTWLIDYTWDNSLKTALVLRNAAVALRDRLTLRNYTGSTSTTYHLFGEHNPPAVADVDGLQTALNGKSNTGHTHNYLPLSGGTLTGDVTVQKNTPRVAFATAEKADVGRARMILYKNASVTVDNGTQLADYVWGDGGAATNKNARLVLRSASTSLPDMLTLNVNEGTGGSTTVYKLYGEHNKPYVTAGQKSGTTLGSKATAEGEDTTASADCAHAEGWKTTASELASHAEGSETVASGEYSHAEGYGTKTPMPYAHAEGCSTEASGTAAHAEGYHTIANRDYQHVFGQYNASSVNSVEIVGWGTSSARKNIRTLDQSGNMTIAGTLTQSSDARLKDVQGEVPDVSGIRAVRFKWNDTNGEHDEKDHIGYIAQEVEAVAPYLVGEDSNGYKSLDYIALLCAKVEMLERQVRELTEARSGK